MWLGRYPIHRLMVGVAVFAVNLAVFREMFASRRIDIIVGGAAPWVILQIGVALALRARGRNRPFWFGFVAGGLLELLTLFAASYSPGSVFGRVWHGYGVFALGLVHKGRPQGAIRRSLDNVWGEIAVTLIVAALEIAPLMLAAGAGGLIARLASRVESRSDAVM